MLSFLVLSCFNRQLSCTFVAVLLRHRFLYFFFFFFHIFVVPFFVVFSFFFLTYIWALFQLPSFYICCRFQISMVSTFILHCCFPFTFDCRFHVSVVLILFIREFVVYLYRCTFCFCHLVPSNCCFLAFCCFLFFFLTVVFSFSHCRLHLSIVVICSFPEWRRIVFVSSSSRLPFYFLAVVLVTVVFRRSHLMCYFRTIWRR